MSKTKPRLAAAPAVSTFHEDRQHLIELELERERVARGTRLGGQPTLGGCLDALQTSCVHADHYSEQVRSILQGVIALLEPKAAPMSAGRLAIAAKQAQDLAEVASDILEKMSDDIIAEAERAGSRTPYTGREVV